MAKGFGIAGLVLAILSVFAVYGFNFFTIWAAMICCTVAALNGERPFSIASVVICLAGMLLFSPITMAAILLGSGNHSPTLAIMAFLPMTFPIIAIVVDMNRRSNEAGSSNSVTPS